MMTTPTPSSTEAQEIWFKGKRVLRTIVQTGVPGFIVFAGVLPLIIGALGLPLNSKVYLWLVGATAVVTAVAGALSRVMAIPAVNAWLIKVGLGSVPASSVGKDALVQGDGLAAGNPSASTPGPDHSA